MSHGDVENDLLQTFNLYSKWRNLCSDYCLLNEVSRQIGVGGGKVGKQEGLNMPRACMASSFFVRFLLFFTFWF